jgi:type IV pilus modification protein PilV
MTSMRHGGGFSLIEVMVAILILGVALVGLTGGLTTALRSSKDSEVQTVAAMFASGQIESIRADGFVDDGETQGDCGDELPMYQWKQSITPGTVDGLHEVKVTVENSQSGEMIYELQTMLFDQPQDSSADDAGKKKDTTKSKKKGGRKS